MKTMPILSPLKQPAEWLPIVVVTLVLVASAVTALLSPVYALAWMGLLVGLLVAGYFVRSLYKFVFLLLVAKPWIDLTWRWRFFTVAEQGVNVQTLVALLVIMVTGLALFLRKRQMVWDVKVVLLLVGAAFSLLLTLTSWGFNELIRLYAGVAFFFTTGIVLSTEDRFNRFARYFILAVSVPVLLSLLQRAGILPFEYWDWIEGQHVGRVSGTYQHPLGLIYFLVYAIPLALYLLSLKQSLRQRLLLWLFIGFSLIALVFTYHRTALLVITFQILLWTILTRRFDRTILLVILGGFIALYLIDWLKLLFENIADILQGKVAFSSGEFLRGRGMNWYLFLNSLFSSHPFFWLFGRGGSVAEGFVPHFGYWSSNEPHNDFIRILHAYGLIGLGLYLSILLGFFRQSLRLRRRRGDRFVHGLGNLMIVVLAAIMLLSITTEPTRYPTGVWYLFALGSVVKVQHRRLGRFIEKSDREVYDGSAQFLH